MSKGDGKQSDGHKRGGKLIVASVRLPVTLTRRQEGWEARASTGGLATALRSVAERRPFTWLGWAGVNVAEEERPIVTRELGRHGSVPIFLSRSDIEGFYEGFSNGVLWPLLHGLAERARFSQQSYRAYERVNQMFAEAIAELAGPDDVIWVHDYQLCLVPDMLRKLGVHMPVGFFLHIPFPADETYRTVPVREAILRGLLGADLLGFHAYEYVSHFRSACLRVLGIESDPEVVRLPARRVHLAVLPIGIDPDEIRRMAASPEAQSELESIREAHGGKKVIVGVDRLDYTKGIPEKLLAYEELLRNQPKWRGRVVLIQVAAPSRENVAEYKQLKRQVDELVGRINGRYGTSSNQPIVYINQNVSRARITGMFQAADVALITPIRDGMNLVALEYVAARAERGGTLILSEFAGAAHLLAGARLVSPYNIVEVAEVLGRALEEPPDPVGFSHMLEFVRENTSVAWASRFLDRLEATAVEQLAPSVRLRVTQPPALDRLRDKKNPLVLLDYDGTLRHFEPRPGDATPTEPIREVLTGLSLVATVYIVSGRSPQVLDGWFGDLRVGLVCEHGYAIRSPRGDWEELTNVGGGGLKRVEQLLADFVRRTPGSLIERKRASIAWHYRSADPEYGTFQANELLGLLEDALKRRPYSILRGSRVIEVRHQDATKGHAMAELLRRHGDADALFCAGDDRTDEEMMEAIPAAWRPKTVTCWVGGRNSIAEFWVDSSEALIEELNALSEIWRRGRSEVRAVRGAKRRTAHGE